MKIYYFWWESKLVNGSEMYDIHGEPSIWINLQLLIEQPKIDWLIQFQKIKRDEYFSKEVYMVNLESVTLIALTSVRLEQTVKALEYSCKGILQRLN
jgi:hypothetical protein